MSATIYEWGDRIGVQWDERGPIIIVTREGDVSIKYNPPADASIIAGVDELVLDEERRAGHDAGYTDALNDAINHLDGSGDAIKTLRRLRGDKV